MCCVAGSDDSVRGARVRHPRGRRDRHAAGARAARQAQVPAYHHQQLRRGNYTTFTYTTSSTVTGVKFRVSPSIVVFKIINVICFSFAQCNEKFYNNTIFNNYTFS